MFSYPTPPDDFVVRDRTPPIWRLSVIFFLAFTALYILDRYWIAPDAAWILLGIGLITICVLTWLTVYFTQRHRDTYLETEFQNALFANAAALHARFSLITQADGTIVYFDPGFQVTFPGFVRSGQRAVDVLLRAGGINQEESAVIYRALEKNSPARLIFSLRSEDGNMQKLIVTVDPLPRPKGYFLFRGRDFVEPRSRDAAPSVLAAASGPIAASLVEGLLESVAVGMYAAAQDGRLLLANPMLERWLGYGKGEIIKQQLSIPQLIHPSEGFGMGQVELTDFEGNVALRRKDGSAFSAYLTQQVRRDAQGVVVGCAGIVYDLDGTSVSPGDKKKPHP